LKKNTDEHIILDLQWKDELTTYKNEWCDYQFQIALLNTNEDVNESKGKNEDEEKKKDEIKKLDETCIVDEWKSIDMKPLPTSTDMLNDEKISKNSTKLKISLQKRQKNYGIRMRQVVNVDNVEYFSRFSNILSIFVPSCKIFESKIMNENEDQILLSYLPNKEKSKIKLLYRGSRDGFGINDFHNKCNNKGSTVIIVQTNIQDHVFGGFTTVPWNYASSGEWKTDGQAFIYVLRSSNPSHSPNKYTIKSGQEQYAVLHYAVSASNNLLRFGDYGAFYLGTNCNINGNNNGAPNPHRSFNAPQDEKLLAGVNKGFTVKELEVFEIE